MSKGGKVNDDILAALAGPKPAPAAAAIKPPRQRTTKAAPAKVAAPAASPSATAEAAPAVSVRHSSREGKKQISGFLDKATLEIMATLRIRLDMDNSELITFALEELYRSHDAKRKFGDA